MLRDYLPEPALYMIRYHSFHACQREGAYRELMNERDCEMYVWVRLFNRYNLYSKSDRRPDAATLWPYYQGLIDRYLLPDNVQGSRLKSVPGGGRAHQRS